MKTWMTVALILALSGCTKAATGPVLGLGLTYVNGQLVSAQVVGQTTSMAQCHKLAAAALVANPPTSQDGATLRLGCAQVELQ